MHCQTLSLLIFIVGCANSIYGSSIAHRNTSSERHLRALFDERDAQDIEREALRAGRPDSVSYDSNDEGTDGEEVEGMDEEYEKMRRIQMAVRNKHQAEIKMQAVERLYMAVGKPHERRFHGDGETFGTENAINLDELDYLVEPRRSVQFNPFIAGAFEEYTRYDRTLLDRANAVHKNGCQLANWNKFNMKVWLLNQATGTLFNQQRRSFFTKYLEEIAVNPRMNEVPYALPYVGSDFRFGINIRELTLQNLGGLDIRKIMFDSATQQFKTRVSVPAGQALNFRLRLKVTVANVFFDRVEDREQAIAQEVDPKFVRKMKKLHDVLPNFKAAYRKHRPKKGKIVHEHKQVKLNEIQQKLVENGHSFEVETDVSIDNFYSEVYLRVLMYECPSGSWMRSWWCSLSSFGELLSAGFNGKIFDYFVGRIQALKIGDFRFNQDSYQVSIKGIHHEFPKGYKDNVLRLLKNGVTKAISEEMKAKNSVFRTVTNDILEDLVIATSNDILDSTLVDSMNTVTCTGAVDDHRLNVNKEE